MQHHVGGRAQRIAYSLARTLRGSKPNARSSSEIAHVFAVVAPDRRELLGRLAA
jgi:hypothetical protein